MRMTDYRRGLRGGWVAVVGLVWLFGIAVQGQRVPDEVVEAGAEVWDVLDVQGRKAAAALLKQVDWEAVSARMSEALKSTDWESLPPLRDMANQALVLLRMTPKGEPYAAWLEPRLDYIEMADAWLRYRASDKYRAPPPKRSSPTTGQKPVSAAAQRKAAREKGPNVVSWKRKVGTHPVPQRAEKLVPELKRIFGLEGVPPELVWLAEVESSFNPLARSPVGAAGLFQFMPATAERFGLRVSGPDERLDPRKSAFAAAEYLRILHDRFGRWDLALAAYNAGEGRVGKTMRKTGGTTFDGIAYALPVETRMYVPKVMATVALREEVDPAGLPAPTKPNGARTK